MPKRRRPAEEEALAEEDEEEEAEYEDSEGSEDEEGEGDGDEGDDEGEEEDDEDEDEEDEEEEEIAPREFARATRGKKMTDLIGQAKQEDEEYWGANDNFWEDDESDDWDRKRDADEKGGESYSEDSDIDDDGSDDDSEEEEEDERPKKRRKKGGKNKKAGAKAKPLSGLFANQKFIARQKRLEKKKKASGDAASSGAPQSGALDMSLMSQRDIFFDDNRESQLNLVSILPGKLPPGEAWGNEEELAEVNRLGALYLKAREKMDKEREKEAERKKKNKGGGVDGGDALGGVEEAFSSTKKGGKGRGRGGAVAGGGKRGQQAKAKKSQAQPKGKKQRGKGGKDTGSDGEGDDGEGAEEEEQTEGDGQGGGRTAESVLLSCLETEKMNLDYVENFTTEVQGEDGKKKEKAFKGPSIWWASCPYSRLWKWTGEAEAGDQSMDIEPAEECEWPCLFMSDFRENVKTLDLDPPSLLSKEHTAPQTKKSIRCTVNQGRKAKYNDPLGHRPFSDTPAFSVLRTRMPLERSRDETRRRTELALMGRLQRLQAARKLPHGFVSQ